MDQNTFHRRETVRRHLQNERRRLPLKERLPQQDPADQRNQDPQQIQRKHHQSLRPAGKEDPDKQQVYGQPCPAGHKRRDQDSQKPFAFRLQRPGRHDSRHTAPESEDHRDKGFSVQTEFMHDTVHDHGNSCEISGVLEDRKKQEQEEDIRQEDNDRPHPADDSVADQRGDPVGSGDSGKTCRGKTRKQSEPFIDQIHDWSADGEHDLEDQIHHGQKDREPQPSAGHDPVDPLGLIFAASFHMIYGFVQNAGDEPVSLICKHLSRRNAVDSCKVGPDRFDLRLF